MGDLVLVNARSCRGHGSTACRPLADLRPCCWMPRSPAPEYASIGVFIERLWRSLKYECVYLHAFETGLELRTGLTRWISYYNGHRPHSARAGSLLTK